MTMHRIQYKIEGINKKTKTDNVSRKEGGRRLSIIEDSVDAII